MTEFSRNQDTEPMSRRRRARIEATRTVLSFLTERHPIYIPPTVPGQIGAVLLPQEYAPEDFARPYEPSPTLIEDTREGLDGDGNYHFIPAIKTEMDRWLPDLPPAA